MLPQVEECIVIYEDAMMLFAVYDTALNDALNVAKPEFLINIVRHDANDEGKDFYKVNEAVLFDKDILHPEFENAQKLIMEKFEVVSAIIDLENKLNFS